MSYDVPGGGKKGSNFVDSSDWMAPFNGRMLVAASHQHGGGKYQTLQSLTCKRRLFKAPVYYGAADHIYNTIRPILHEPGPIGNGAYATAKGIPITKGEVLERVAVHDNHNLHVAAMGFWATWFVRDDSRQAVRPDARRHRRDQQAASATTTRRDYDLVGAAARRSRRARSRAFNGGALEVGDNFFRPRQDHGKGRPAVTWRFAGDRAAQRDGGQRPARVLVDLLGPDERHATRSRRR